MKPPHSCPPRTARIKPSSLATSINHIFHSSHHLDLPHQSIVLRTHQANFACHINQSECSVISPSLLATAIDHVHLPDLWPRAPHSPIVTCKYKTTHVFMLAVQRSNTRVRCRIVTTPSRSSRTIPSCPCRLQGVRFKFVFLSLKSTFSEAV